MKAATFSIIQTISTNIASAAFIAINIVPDNPSPLSHAKVMTLLIIGIAYTLLSVVLYRSLNRYLIAMNKEGNNIWE